MKGGEQQGAVLSILTALQTANIVSSQKPPNSPPHYRPTGLVLTGLCIPDQPAIEGLLDFIPMCFTQKSGLKNLDPPYIN